jgi:hypothetical protein
MAKKELVNYIKKEVAAGYDISYLRDYLIKQGYSAKDVDQAIDSLSGKSKALKMPSNVMIISIVAVVILVIGIFAIVRLMQPGPADEVTLPTVSQERTTMTIPGTETEPGITTPVLQEQEEPEVEVRYRGTDVTAGQVLDRIPYISESEAVNLCKRLFGKDKDSCFMRIALEKGNSENCASIINIRKKDDCYMSFAYLNDFSVCVEIQDVYLKQSCRELGKLEY